MIKIIMENIKDTLGQLSSNIKFDLKNHYFSKLLLYKKQNKLILKLRKYIYNKHIKNCYRCPFIYRAHCDIPFISCTLLKYPDEVISGHTDKSLCPLEFDKTLKK